MGQRAYKTRKTTVLSQINILKYYTQYLLLKVSLATTVKQQAESLSSFVFALLRAALLSTRLPEPDTWRSGWVSLTTRAGTAIAADL